MKGGGNKTQTTTVDPQTQQYRDEVFNRARQVSNQPYSAYGGPTVADANPYSSSALAGMSGLPNAYNQLAGQAGQIGDMVFGSGVPANMDFKNFAMPGDRNFGNFNTDLNFNFKPYEDAGAVGARAMGGDQSAITSLMNPYTSQVIDRLTGQFDKLRGAAALSANNDATAGGAFGGDRHALLTGARLGAVDAEQGDQLANLLYGGFNDTMNRAGAAANLGMGAGQLDLSHILGAAGLKLGAEQAGADYALGRGNLGLSADKAASDYALGAGAQRLQGQGMTLDARRAALEGQLGALSGQQSALGQQFGMGDYMRGINQAKMTDAQQRFNEQRDWNLRGLDILKGGMTGMPYGQTSSEPLQRNAFAGAAGGALTGAQIGSIIPGLGTAAGGIIGGLGGLLFG